MSAAVVAVIALTVTNLATLAAGTAVVLKVAGRVQIWRPPAPKKQQEAQR